MRLIVAALVAVIAGPALAHWQYDSWCCNTTDCAPYPSEKVQIVEGGWYLHDFDKFIAHDDKNVRAPLDDRYHVCELPKGTVRCFYPPGGGV
jgi:hypothetical protein